MHLAVLNSMSYLMLSLITISDTTNSLPIQNLVTHLNSTHIPFPVFLLPVPIPILASVSKAFNSKAATATTTTTTTTNVTQPNTQKSSRTIDEGAGTPAVENKPAEEATATLTQAQATHQQHNHVLQRKNFFVDVEEMVGQAFDLILDFFGLSSLHSKKPQPSAAPVPLAQPKPPGTRRGIVGIAGWERESGGA